MNPDNRRYNLRYPLAEPHKENRGTVLQNREELLTVEQPLATPLQPAEPQMEHLPTPPPPAEPVDLSVIPTMMMQPTGIHLEKFAGDDSVDAKSWLNWFGGIASFTRRMKGSSSSHCLSTQYQMRAFGMMLCQMQQKLT